VDCCIRFPILTSFNPPFTLFFKINLAYTLFLSPLNFMEKCEVDLLKK
jgi:hypothetical protein